MQNHNMPHFQDPEKKERVSVTLLFFLFLAYLLFMIYGSLVPFAFHHMSFSDALVEFRKLRFVSIDHISRIDWATNILLGIPASFLGMATFYRIKGFTANALVALTVFLICFTASLTAEFLQLFFSTRIASVNDIVAQVIGEGFGIFCWFVFGKTLVQAFLHFVGTRSFSYRLQFIFWGYLAIVMIYSIMPLDLSLNPTDIYHKWKTGYINIIPFSFHVESTAQLVYNITIDIFIWLAPAFFMAKFQKYSIFMATGLVFIAAVSIEIIQFFIMTRISDTTDVITAVMGGFVGASAGAVYVKNREIRTPNRKKDPYTVKPTSLSGYRILTGLFFFLLWIGMVLSIYWYPYNFVIDKQTIREQMQQLSLIPFYHYQDNTIYNAITQLFRKIIFFFPGGVILSFIIKGGRFFSAAVNFAIIFSGMILIFGVAGMVEIGQFFIPERGPDLTDILLEIAGAWLGFFLSNKLYQAARSS
nr:VanZ family protein [Desulfobacula sp.]